MDIASLILSSSLQYYGYLIPLFIFIALIKSAWFKGMVGEFIVNRSLKKLSREYTLIKNVTLPTADGTTQVDHIVISPYGIFVIETKHMKGWIFGSEFQKTWTQKIYRHTSKFQNPLRQNYKHIKTIEHLLNCDSSCIHSIIVFIGSCEFKTPMPVNVIRRQEMILYIQSCNTIVFNDKEIDEIIVKLTNTRLAPTLVTSHQHKQHVRKIIEDKQNVEPVLRTESSNFLDNPSCPNCGSLMVLKTAKRGKNQGNQFWGCSDYPRCKAIVAYHSEDGLTRQPSI
ncbi:TPA: NERD domain-containing protein [Photobacterium damselae]